MNLAEIRAQYPQYTDLSDGDLLVGLHKKFYSDMHPRVFLNSIEGAQDAHATIKDPALWDYWQSAVSQPMQGETGQQTETRLGGGETIDNSVGMGETAARGALQGLTFGLGDEIVAGGASFLSGTPYDKILEVERGQLEKGREQHPVAAYGSEITGGVATGLTGLGAVGKAATLPGQVARTAGVGAAEGGVYGFNSGEGGLRNRLETGKNGALLGAGLGVAAQPVGRALSKAAESGKSLAQTITGSGQAEKAQYAIQKALERSGQSADDVGNSIRIAADEGQPQYALVDALGRPGQRMLSGVTRSTPEASQQVQDYLISRQSGQGDRVASFISDAFDAPNSAKATKEAMVQARSSAADTNYAAAREGAGAVDVRNALGVIDDRVGGVIGSGLRGDGIDSKLLSFRDRLAAANPEATQFNASSVELSDFDRVLGVKQDIQDAIGAAVRAGRNNEARELGKLTKALDESLESSSQGYRYANDAFATASREIDQIKAGQQAAAPRTRAEDTISKFNGLSEGEQTAFRAGYADPLISRIESNAVGANAARPLTSQKFQQEAGALSVDPDLLNRRLARENQMFSTNNTVLGGSRTADNLIDMEDAGRFDFGPLANLFRGRFGEAAMQMVEPVFNGLRGHSPAVRQEMAGMLTSSGDTAAGLAEKFMLNSQKNKAAQQLMIDRAAAAGGTGAGMAQGY